MCIRDRFDTAKLEQEIQALMMDDDVTNKRGIYSYVLTRNEKYLNIRPFTAVSYTHLDVYKRQVQGAAGLTCYRGKQIKGRRTPVII